MSKAALSVLTFGVYALITGIGLALAPQLLLAPFGIPSPTAVWVRVAGAVVINVGVLYIVAAKSESRAFFAASIPTRALILVWFSAFVVLQWVSPALLVFGLLDAIAAAWTWSALRADRRGA